jgi:hypothetical protein
MLGVERVKERVKGALPMGSIISLAGLALAGLALWLNYRTSREQRLDAQRTDGAGAVGRVWAVLTDLDPDRLGINATKMHTPPLLHRLRVKWHEIRDELAALAVGSADKDVRRLANHLLVAMHNTVTASSSFALSTATGGLGGPAQGGFTRDVARKDHQIAQEVTAVLAAALREERLPNYPTRVQNWPDPSTEPAAA